MNEKNLMPIEEVNSRRTREKHSEDSRKAGVASGRARREQKVYRELAKTLLDTPITQKGILKELKRYGVEETTLKAYTLLGLIKACGKGNHNAFDRLWELTGEKETPPDAKQFNEGLAILADLINNPAPNRNITDFEENDNA